MKIFNNEDKKQFRRSLRRNMTDSEKALWFYLRQKKIQQLRFYRQYGIGDYIVDFYCPKINLVIEVDGDTHYTEKGIQHDEQRTLFLNSVGIEIIRFTNHEVKNMINDVLHEIHRKCRMLLLK